MIAKAIQNYLSRNAFTTFAPKAALIDMDGTLLDSMSRHTLAWHRLMTELGVECTRDEFYLYEGMTGTATINHLFKRAFHRSASKEEAAELYARKTGYFNELPRAETVAGAQRMVATLMSRGITRVLVTGSGQLSNLERLDTDFPGGFPHHLRVTARNVNHGKPHPEPYLKAMEMAGVQPWQSIVVENAPLGVQAGARARAFTVAVTTGPVPESKLREAGADLVLPSMEAFADLLPHILEGATTRQE